MRIKIAIITNIPTLYRKVQWEYFAKLEGFDITVYYCAHTEKSRVWNIGLAKGVKEVFLRGVSYRDLHFNPGIFRVVLKKFDVFMVGGYSYPTLMLAILLLRILNKPYIMVVDGDSQQSLVKTTAGLTAWVRRFFMPGASAYFASGTTGRLFCKKFGAPDNGIFNQFLTVDVNSFVSRQSEAVVLREKLRAELGISKNTTVALYVGRLLKDKGIQDLIEAVSTLRESNYNIVALIIGEGIYRGKLEQHAMISPGSTIFIGHINPTELWKYYYASDVFALPTYYDRWGLVVNEAMACSLPVVTTNAAGCYPDLVSNGKNGYVLKAGSVEELVGALTFLMNSESRRRLGKESQRIISKWTYKESTEQFGEIINFVLQNK